MEIENSDHLMNNEAERPSPAIHYSRVKEQPAQQVADVFRRAGMKRPWQDLTRIGKMIAHADILITAWHEERMVGVARAITDYSYCCYLSDLAVDEAYQKLGIGSELVKDVQREIGDECSLVLLSAPQAVGYYPKLGFEHADKAFVIKRKT